MLPFGSALLARRSRRHLRQSPAMTGRGSTHIATAFMGLTSSGGVTVHCKLQARATARPFISQPRDHDSERARAVAGRIRRGGPARPGHGRLHDRARAPECRRGPQKGALVGEPAHHAIGRSRGGLTTKIHLAADSRWRPLCFVLTPGQAGDAPAFEHVMAALRAPRTIGRPRTRPEGVLADRAYSSRAIREHLRRRGIRAVIPPPADQIANRRRKGRQGGRPPAFDREA